MFKEDLSMFENRESKEATDNRKRAVLAMAVAMGADEAGARENIEGMFDMAENLGKLDYKKGLDSPDREEIIRIGSWFLPKDKESQWFAVGVRALKLMREPRDSESFSDLRRTVECWGPAGGLEKFDGIAGEK